MKALRFHAFGPPAVLAVEEVGKPEPGPGEVLVEVRAAAINPSDVKNVAGFFPATRLPRTPGRDFAGVIASGRRQGEEVWGSGPGMGMARDGVHAEYVVVAEAALARKPHRHSLSLPGASPPAPPFGRRPLATPGSAELSLEEAAALGVPYLTAWAGLMRAAQVRAGETVLVVGAGGAVGQAAAQIAHWKGARVLGAGRHGPVAGVDASVTTDGGKLREQVMDLTDGQGAEVVFDLVGGAMFEQALGCLRHGGRQVAITSVGERRVSFDLVDFYHNEAHLLGVDSNHFSAEEAGAMANELVAGFEAGALQPPEIEVIPFTQAIAAYERVAKGEARRKTVLGMKA